MSVPLNNPYLTAPPTDQTTQLFEGKPTLKHLSLWSRDATFADPLTNAVGFDKFAAQWYGLPALFNPIKIQSHKVTSSGNPIELELSNKYVVKGIKKEQVIDSIINIYVGSNGKIEKVEDKWDGKLPEGGVSAVSFWLRSKSSKALAPVVAFRTRAHRLTVCVL
jgi:hypothetical protein